MQINVREFEREHYLSLKDGLEKLTGIWTGAEEPKIENHKDDKKKVNAMVMAVSAMHL